MHDTIETLATVLFALAVLHTFAVKKFQHIASRFPQGSVGENFYHLLGEVEVIFGLWAGVLVLCIAVLKGGNEAVQYIENLNFTEPAFVFVVMAVAATRPIVQIAFRIIEFKARVIPLPKPLAFYSTALIGGPLLGSFITEPAAMTVTALILKETFFEENVSPKFKYLTLAVLFVNISIGGVLTHFAAPPVLMVASKWNWGTAFMFSHFGWKAVIATILNTVITVSILRKELLKIRIEKKKSLNGARGVPIWLTIIHILFLVFIVLTAHHALFFLGLFLFFQGIISITQEYQDDLKLRESLLVGFFLGGLVVLGSFQGWWLKPILTELTALPLFAGATLLTAFVDNAALTFLGTQVPNLDENLKYALVSGAVAGGGLTVIANAPNPAGFAILRSSFGSEGISPVTLFLYALFPTLTAMACLWFFPGAGT